MKGERIIQIMPDHRNMWALYGDVTNGEVNILNSFQVTGWALIEDAETFGHGDERKRTRVQAMHLSTDGESELVRGPQFLGIATLPEGEYPKEARRYFIKDTWHFDMPSKIE